jgi:hypothetical protein
LAKFEVENHSLNQKVQFLTEETKKLEISLDKSRDNGERLHKESEMVIANVNQWVHEQRYVFILLTSLSTKFSSNFIFSEIIAKN